MSNLEEFRRLFLEETWADVDAAESRVSQLRGASREESHRTMGAKDVPTSSNDMSS